MSGPRSSAELWGPRIVIALLRLLPKTCDQLLLWPITLGDRVEIPFSCFGGPLSAVSKSIVATTASLWSSRRHLQDWTIPIPESRDINMKSIQNVWIFVRLSTHHSRRFAEIYDVIKKIADFLTAQVWKFAKLIWKSQGKFYQMQDFSVKTQYLTLVMRLKI